MSWIKTFSINVSVLCTLLVVLELSAKTILFIKGNDLYRLFTNTEVGVASPSEDVYPHAMGKMRLADFPLIKLHEYYESRNFNALKSGFRGGQRDFEILKFEHKYVTVRPSNRDVDYMFLGGSTTFGVGVSDKDTVPEIFNELSPEQGVLNLGLGGNTLEGSIQILQEFLRNNNAPQRTIFLDGINEDWCWFFTPEKVNSDWVNKRSVNNPYVSNYNLEILLKKVSNKYLFTTEKGTREKEIGAQACAQRYIDSLKWLDDLSAHFNFRSYHFLQPSAWTVDVNEFDYENLSSSSRGRFYNQFYDEVMKLYADTKLFNVKVFDLRDILKPDDRSKQRIFVDAQHLSEFGNRQISNAILKIVSD